jgi:hypothetical protein
MWPTMVGGIRLTRAGTGEAMIIAHLHPPICKTGFRYRFCSYGSVPCPPIQEGVEPCRAAEVGSFPDC